MAVRTVLKQSDKNARGTQVKRNGLAFTVHRSVTSSRIALRHLSHPGSMSSLQGTSLEERLTPEAYNSWVRLSRQSVLKVPKGPHTGFCPNYTWGTLSINNCGGPIRQFPFRHWDNLLCAYWISWPTFFLIRFYDGTVWMSQKVVLQLFFKLQLGLCAVFTRVSDHARFSLTPFGEGYTKQGPCLFSWIWRPLFLCH